MWISHLALNDFRSYTGTVLEFSPGVTIFVGENGQGKTNLVEAIGYLATLSSHRVSADAALVRQGGPAAVVRARAHDGDHETMLEIEILAGRANRARLNRGNAKPRDLLGIVRAVVFSPEDLPLVNGDPSVRRRYLDEVAIQQRPRMAHIRAEYDRVLRQRTALLKSASMAKRRGQPIDRVSFSVWDEQLAELGAVIIAHRTQIVRSLRPLVRARYEEIAPGRGITHLVYLANVDDDSKNVPAFDVLNESNGGLGEIEESLLDVAAVKERLLAEIDQLRDREIDRGVNLVGPHRDDLLLGLGSLPAKGFASHGETWSYALSLRLAEWELLRGDEGESDPLLILDDVFAELDSRRRSALASIIGAEQVFITAAVGDDIPPELMGTRFRVHDGEVTKLDR